MSLFRKRVVRRIFWDRHNPKRGWLLRNRAFLKNAIVGFEVSFFNTKYQVLRHKNSPMKPFLVHLGNENETSSATITCSLRGQPSGFPIRYPDFKRSNRFSKGTTG